MFLFAPIPWYSWVAWFVVLGGLIALNEITCRWKWAGLGFFVLLPALLTLFVWPITAGPGSSTGTWFHWVKVYSALAGCLGFMAIRYWPKLAANKWALLFPPAILAINIAEACIRDFQVGAMNANGLVDGVFMVSGPWNYLNGVAGLINLITIWWLERHHHLPRLQQGHDLAGHAVVLDHRLRPVELRLRLQLRRRPLLLRRCRPADQLHHPGLLHQARRLAATAPTPWRCG